MRSLILLASCGLLAAAVAPAAVIVIEFEGTVTRLNGSAGFLSGFEPGSLVTGSFQYEEGSLPGQIFGDPDVSNGVFYAATNVLQTVTVNGVTFTADAPKPAVQTNRYENPIAFHTVALASTDTSDPVRGAGFQANLAVSFGDFSGTLLGANLALPGVDGLIASVAAGQAGGSISFPGADGSVDGIVFSVTLLRVPPPTTTTPTNPPADPPKTEDPPSTDDPEVPPVKDPEVPPMDDPIEIPPVIIVQPPPTDLLVGIPEPSTFALALAGLATLALARRRA